MQSTSTLSHPFPNAVRERSHPWISALEWFGIPFLGYAPDGCRTFVSPSAAQLLDGGPAGMALGRRADAAAAVELARPKSLHLHPADFVLTAEVGCPSLAVTLSTHVVRPRATDYSVIVIIRPQSALRTDDRRLTELTPREREVAHLIADGLATKEIARRLGISYHTARHHTEGLFTKLGVRCRAAVGALLGPRSLVSPRGTREGR